MLEWASPSQGLNQFENLSPGLIVDVHTLNELVLSSYTQGGVKTINAHHTFQMFLLEDVQFIGFRLELVL